MAIRVVYVAGLGHSGSTLLDLCLGAHKDLIGLGEVNAAVRDVDHVIKESEWSPCSCGTTMAKCPFWSKLLPKFDSLRDAPVAERYQAVIDAFAETFPGKVMCDSSKGRSGLSILSACEGIDLRVIRLWRDVRSWSVSVRRHRERRELAKLTDCLRKQGPKGIGTWAMGAYLVTFWQWYISNRRMEGLIRKLGNESFSIGYEELALYPEMILKRICEFLDLEYDPRMLVPSNTHSHVARGNPMRSRPDKLQRIQYDDRWFRANRLLLASCLSPHVMRLNRKKVYANVEHTLWESKQLYGQGVHKPDSSDQQAKG